MPPGTIAAAVAAAAAIAAEGGPDRDGMAGPAAAATGCAEWSSQLPPWASVNCSSETYLASTALPSNCRPCISAWADLHWPGVSNLTYTRPGSKSGTAAGGFGQVIAITWRPSLWHSSFTSSTMSARSSSSRSSFTWSRLSSSRLQVGGGAVGTAAARGGPGRAPRPTWATGCAALAGPPMGSTYPLGRPTLMLRPHRSTLSKLMAEVASSSERSSTKPKRPVGSSWQLTTGGLVWGSGTREARAPLNSSRSIISFTTPMVRLPTYTSRCFLLLCWAAACPASCCCCCRRSCWASNCCCSCCCCMAASAWILAWCAASDAAEAAGVGAGAEAGAGSEGLRSRSRS
mmetsp:Transcript_20762/g.57645  ORF Transcript_20762/g.57645 Transcript_20762/m.57645 type:complete len:345 (-) Transcript_20762:511-1545(-)